MGDDALERLKKRTRPTVPSRDASLISTTTDISTSRNQDLQIPALQAPQISAPIEAIQPLMLSPVTVAIALTLCLT